MRERERATSPRLLRNSLKHERAGSLRGRGGERDPEAEGDRASPVRRRPPPLPFPVRGALLSKSPAHARVGREPTAQTMSRAALSKSRMDKSRVVPPVQIPQVSVEIVPGRFTETDWIAFINQEEGQEIVGDVLEGLLSRVLDECFEVYLAKQRVPFTISQARDAMIKIIEWRFLVRDEGEPDMPTDDTGSWQEDEEPTPCITDSWAQGSVPVIHTGLTPRPEDKLEVAINEPVAQEVIVTTSIKPAEELIPQPLSPSPEQSPEPENLPEENMQTSQVLKVEKELKPLCRPQKLVHQPAPPPKQDKPRREFRPHRGPLRSAGLKNITKSLEDTEKEMLFQQLSQAMLKEETEEGLGSLKLLPTSFHNILRIQLNRPAQNKDVMYDEFGKITSVPKLDPARLPRHWIKPQVEVVDPNKEAEHQRKEMLRAGGPAAVRQGTRSKNSNASKATRDKRLDVGQSSNFELKTSRNDPLRITLNSKVFNHLDMGTQGKTSSLQSVSRSLDISGPISLKPSVLLESMQLAPGVVVREGNGTDRNSWRGPRHQESEIWEPQGELRPMRTTVPCPSIAVDQLLKNHIPQVRPVASFPAFAPFLKGRS